MREHWRGMIRIALFAAALLAAPAAAKSDVPLSPVGLPFGPNTPQRVSAGHPLFRTVAIVETDALPERLGPAKRAAFVTALTGTLDRLGMLAADPAQARFRLAPSWLDMDSPFRISFKSKATVRMAWRVTRADTGKTIFAREIATVAESSGGSAPERKKGVERVALMTNIASAAGCIQQAAIGRPPGDCALTPGFTYRAPNPPVVMFLPR